MLRQRLIWLGFEVLFATVGAVAAYTGMYETSGIYLIAAILCDMRGFLACDHLR